MDRYSSFSLTFMPECESDVVPATSPTPASPTPLVCRAIGGPGLPTWSESWRKGRLPRSRR